jgi:hypothetical protein
MPFDVMLNLFAQLKIGDVEDYCKTQHKGIEQCQWIFKQGNLTTRVAIDFVIWTIDRHGNWDIESSETVIIRIKWRTIDELKTKIKTIQGFLVNHQHIPFQYNEFIIDQLDDSAASIDENTLFADLFDKVWTIAKYERIIDLLQYKNDTDSVDSELDILRCTWRFDVEWPSGNFKNEYNLIQQLKNLLDIKQLDIDDAISYYHLPKEIASKITRNNNGDDDDDDDIDRLSYHDPNIFF